MLARRDRLAVYEGCFANDLNEDGTEPTLPNIASNAIGAQVEQRRLGINAKHSLGAWRRRRR